MIKSRNIYNEAQISQAKQLSEKLNIPNEVSLLLLNQGVNEKTADLFFNPKYSDLHSPFLMKNMQKSVFRIFKAIEEKQKITIFCDYDVDGTTACSILFLYFKDLGVDVNYYTPDRHNEGYGLNEAAVNRIVEHGTNLVITVDCGITNAVECKILMDNGIDVIVVDHHECGEVLPDTQYILNPKQEDCEYPYKHLSGAGIAFKLLQGLDNDVAYKNIDYAAVGTISDIVPLDGENRIIAKVGLEKMNKDISFGLGLLREFVLPKSKKIDEYHIGFGFGPRINAAGRMESAEIALDVLLSTEESKVSKAAAFELNELNDTRKSICDKITKQAEAQISKNNILKDIGAIFVMGDWEQGVVGICASRLSNKYSRPVFVFSEKGDEAVCSARSIEQINIHEVLSNFTDYFIKFGGHHMAAGLTIKTKDFDALKNDVNGYLKEYFDQSTFVRTHVYDVELNVSEYNEKFAHDINRLAPYGQKNPKPKLLFRDIEIADKSYFGKNDKNHMKFNVKAKGSAFGAIKFFYSNKDNATKHGHIIGNSNINDYNKKAEIFVDYIEQADIGINTNSIFSLKNTVEDMAKLYYRIDKNEKVVSLNEAVLNIKDKLDGNFFGICIVVDNAYQLEVLQSNDIIKQMISDSKLAFRFDSDYDLPVNAIMFSKKIKTAIKPYEEIIYFGDGELDIEGKRVTRFCIKEIDDKYRAIAKDFFASKQEMGQIFITLKSFVVSKYKFKDEDDVYMRIASKSKISLNKTVSGLIVLKQLGLIEFEKSDMMVVKIIEHSEKKDLEDSQVYYANKNLIG